MIDNQLAQLRSLNNQIMDQQSYAIGTYNSTNKISKIMDNFKETIDSSSIDVNVVGSHETALNKVTNRYLRDINSLLDAEYGSNNMLRLRSQQIADRKNNQQLISGIDDSLRESTRQINQEGTRRNKELLDQQKKNAGKSGSSSPGSNQDYSGKSLSEFIKENLKLEKILLGVGAALRTVGNAAGYMDQKFGEAASNAQRQLGLTGVEARRLSQDFREMSHTLQKELGPGYQGFIFSQDELQNAFDRVTNSGYRNIAMFNQAAMSLAKLEKVSPNLGIDQMEIYKEILQTYEDGVGQLEGLVVYNQKLSQEFWVSPQKLTSNQNKFTSYVRAISRNSDDYSKAMKKLAVATAGFEDSLIDSSTWASLVEDIAFTSWGDSTDQIKQLVGLGITDIQGFKALAARDPGEALMQIQQSARNGPLGQFVDSSGQFTGADNDYSWGQFLAINDALSLNAKDTMNLLTGDFSAYGDFNNREDIQLLNSGIEGQTEVLDNMLTNEVFVSQQDKFNNSLESLKDVTLGGIDSKLLEGNGLLSNVYKSLMGMYPILILIGTAVAGGSIINSVKKVAGFFGKGGSLTGAGSTLAGGASTAASSAGTAGGFASTALGAKLVGGAGSVGGALKAGVAGKGVVTGAGALGTAASVALPAAGAIWSIVDGVKGAGRSEEWLGEGRTGGGAKTASFIGGALGGQGPGIGQGSAGDTAKNILAGAGKGALIGSVAGPVGAAIGGAIGAGLSAIGGERIAKFADTVGTGVKNWATDVGDTFKDLAGNVTDIWTDENNTLWDKFKKSGKAAFETVANDTTGLFGGFGNIKNLFSRNKGATVVDGSHKDGLDKVPFDGYIAELHRNEAVLPAEEATSWRSLEKGIYDTKNYKIQRADYYQRNEAYSGRLKQDLKAALKEGDAVLTAEEIEKWRRQYPASGPQEMGKEKMPNGYRSPFQPGQAIPSSWGLVQADSKVTSAYEWRTNPAVGGYESHNGVDLSGWGGVGQTLTTPMTARVKSVSSNNWGGNFVIMELEDGTEMRYYHMASRSPLQEGSVVPAGGAVGTAGTTGWSTGVHLHYEVFPQGQGYRVDPLVWLDSAMHDTKYTEEQNSLVPTVSGDAGKLGSAAAGGTTSAAAAASGGGQSFWTQLADSYRAGYVNTANARNQVMQQLKEGAITSFNSAKNLFNSLIKGGSAAASPTSDAGKYSPITPTGNDTYNPVAVSENAYGANSNTDFINKIAPGAISTYKSHSILPSLTISQGILESGWGKSGLTVNANNLYGIKADSSWTGERYSSKTWEEYTPGQRTDMVDWFRKYPDWEASTQDHGQFLQSSRYDKVRSAQDAATAIQEVKAAGYATASDYVSQLRGLVDRWDLERYDAQAKGTSSTLSNIEGANLSTYAYGDIVDRATLGVFGEAGKEALIPLSDKYRTRGIELWTQAGQELGVLNQTAGVGRTSITGMVGTDTVPGGGSIVDLDVSEIVDLLEKIYTLLDERTGKMIKGQNSSLANDSSVMKPEAPVRRGSSLITQYT